MNKPRDLVDTCATIEAHLAQLPVDERGASIDQISGALAMPPTAVLKALRRLAKNGVVRRDPTPPLSRATIWHLGNGIPLPPKRAGTIAVDGAPLQRLVAAHDTRRAVRDPLVAALFGVPGAQPPAPPLPDEVLVWAPELPPALQQKPWTPPARSFAC